MTMQAKPDSSASQGSPGQSSHALLEHLIRGRTLTQADLAEVVQLPEDLHLEFKSGLELSDRKKGAATLRQYATGFSNSDGGVLIFGVDDHGSVDGCRRVGQATLVEWASRVLSPDVAPRLSIQPRYIELALPEAGSYVLLVAISRAPSLVPVVVERRLAYYFRHGDETIRADDYLISDLVLGRRQNPDFDVTLAPEIVTGRHGAERLRLLVDLENVSLRRGEHLRLGLAAWGQSEESEGQRMSTGLRRHIVIPHEGYWSRRGRMSAQQYFSEGPSALDALADARYVIDGPRFPSGSRRKRGSGTLFLLGDFPPIFWQVNLNPIDEAYIRYERTSRPLISWPHVPKRLKWKPPGAAEMARFVQERMRMGAQQSKEQDASGATPSEVK